MSCMTLQWKFKWKWPDTAQLWPQYGPNNLTQKNFLCFGKHDSLVKILAFYASGSIYIVEVAKHGPDMAQTWSSYGPFDQKLKSILLFGMYNFSVKKWAISGI